jgi:hypothetical protein
MLPAANTSFSSPATASSPSSAEIRESIDAIVDGLRPVFFACGLYGNPFACSGYPDTDPFLGSKVCVHRPLEGVCSSPGVVLMNYSSTSKCAAE